jgi:hypothetical protein
MADPRFDPSGAVTFDLQHGLVHREGAPPTVLVPHGGLLALCAAAGHDAAIVFGRAVGAAMGGRLAARFAGSREVDSNQAPASVDAAAAVRRASIEAVVEHLGGELALGGFGCLSLERWGRAMVLVVDHAPLGAAGDALLEAILEGALVACTGRSPRVGILHREESRARFFVGSPAAIQRVQTQVRVGETWAEALVQLHDGASEGGT